MVRLSEGNCLEVGCADGYISHSIKQKGLDVLATDIDINAVKRAKDRGSDALVCDVRFLPFRDRAFTTVIAGELLEHLENMGDSLRELCRVCDKKVLISLPTLSAFENPSISWENNPDHKWQIRGCGVTHADGRLLGLSNLDISLIILQFTRWEKLR